MSALRWSHTALNCADQAATEGFYTRLFGFRRVRVVPIPDGEIVFLRSGAVLLELFAAVAGPDPTAGGDGPHTTGTVRHIAFQTDDVDGFLTRTGDAASVTLGPADFDDVIPGWRTVWLRDPDGVIVEVSQGYRDARQEHEDQHDPSSTDHAREPA